MTERPGYGPLGGPRYVWRKHRLLYPILAVSLFVLFTGVPIRGYWVTVGCGGLSVASGVLLLSSRRSLRRRMFANNLEMCMACGYSLIGLAESGVCPECGTPFCKTDTIAAWKRWANV